MKRLEHKKKKTQDKNKEQHRSAVPKKNQIQKEEGGPGIIALAFFLVGREKRDKGLAEDGRPGYMA